ncbi:hypothetical protein V6N12_022845 [Hibiscus sabdariffa]|uniref:RNase H type-1 domain-containing protein n=1 Tax=Hibiscus sabdariffa TaxID=183260 RepID=A0ABR2FVW9_9ROSI
MGSASDLLPNHSDDWLIGFNKKVGFSSLLQSEFWGIYVDLCLAWDHGYKHVQVQYNCSEALKLISSPLAGSDAYALVRAIAYLVERHWLIDFVIIRREANFATSFLVKLPTVDDGSVRFFSESLANIGLLLHRHLHGLIYY